MSLNDHGRKVHPPTESACPAPADGPRTWLFDHALEAFCNEHNWDYLCDEMLRSGGFDRNLVERVFKEWLGDDVLSDEIDEDAFYKAYQDTEKGLS